VLYPPAGGLARQVRGLKAAGRSSDTGWTVPRRRPRSTWHVPTSRIRAVVLIVDAGADPWVVHSDGTYYYCHVVDDASVHVRASATLEGIGQVEAVEVWRPPAHLQTLWAPELHHLDGRWYVYVAADDGDNAQHRMHVLSADTPLGPFEHRGQITTEDDSWAIDGTVLEHGGRRYFVWSGWEEPHRPDEQRLYIAEMSSPTTLTGPRVCIAVPTEPWEAVGMPVLEGPVALSRPGRTALLYAASHSLTDDYCLGVLDLIGSDPLDPAAWHKRREPVFATSPGVSGPGHASVVADSDESGWVVYHTHREPGSGWDRQVRMAAYTWAADGTLRVTPDECLLPAQRVPSDAAVAVRAA
jgi:GH43 family beta-xylosidase